MTPWLILDFGPVGPRRFLGCTSRSHCGNTGHVGPRGGFRPCCVQIAASFGAVHNDSPASHLDLTLRLPPRTGGPMYYVSMIYSLSNSWTRVGPLCLANPRWRLHMYTGRGRSAIGNFGQSHFSMARATAACHWFTLRWRLQEPQPRNPMVDPASWISHTGLRIQESARGRERK